MKKIKPRALASTFVALSLTFTSGFSNIAKAESENSHSNGAGEHHSSENHSSENHSNENHSNENHSNENHSNENHSGEHNEGGTTAGNENHSGEHNENGDNGGNDDTVDNGNGNGDTADNGNGDSNGDGNDNSGSQDNTTQTTASNNQPEQKLKVRVLPLAFGNYDILNKAVNLTSDEKLSGLSLKQDNITLDDFQNGFAVTQIRKYELGLGIAPQIYLENATGLAALATGIAGIAAVKNSFVQYERLVNDERLVDDLPTLGIPYNYEKLQSYKPGESVFYESTGGMMYSIGAGVAGAFTGGSVVAEGGFRTFIKKDLNNTALVQITKTKIKKSSLFTGLGIYVLDSTKLDNVNNGFSYSFDFKIGGKNAINAYQELVKGNAIPAQKLSLNSLISGVAQVDSFDNNEITKSHGVSFGIPMIASVNSTTSKIVGQTNSLFNSDKSTTELNYGVYLKEQSGRFFLKHKQLVRSFYAGKAENFDSNKKLLSEDQTATYLWSYENDSGKSWKLKDALAKFHQDTGLRANFNPTYAKGENLSYIKLEVSAELPASYTQKLLSKSVSGSGISSVLMTNASKMLESYFSQGDLDNLCRTNESNELLNETLSECKTRLQNETKSSVENINSILKEMSSKKENSAEFVKTYAQAGKELLKNQFVLNSLFALDTECELSYSVKVEGRRINKLTKKIPANLKCR